VYLASSFTLLNVRRAGVHPSGAIDEICLLTFPQLRTNGIHRSLAKSNAAPPKC
jgi:hypothetical protein